ncbi:hypothetical protein J8273_5622 [Carpediemonas membranifera]|uniref:Reverse transcriptase RNase H-like domain-containing protein n=1 Tax=Carpediemonas membranifera TaxID=201153 RepID=A0A8J6BX30_9EUKA|nr:hypothetical protein J8273_5622 [Carpediemonas membranifera]|eukprot:KAG9393036.1 hypothetical protein J8273_5622 [Carpediemonas membranifera]
MIPSFAETAEPIIALTRSGVAWRWEAPQEQALERIKETLLDNMDLHDRPRPPENPNQPLHLYTDASDIGIGAVLITGTGSGMKVVSYFSKTLTPVQRRWSTYEQEGFAIMSVIAQAQHFLRGRHFTLHTDHRNLVFMAATAPKVQRWRLQLQTYEFDILHVAGTDNGAADALSRLLSVTLLPSEREELIMHFHGRRGGHVGYRAVVEHLREAGVLPPSESKLVSGFGATVTA